MEDWQAEAPNAGCEASMADAAGDERQLWFTVLGAVAVRRGEQELDAGSPRQRALLAVLLLQGGRGISRWS